MHLREYQQRAVDQTRQAIIDGFKRPLIVASTGSGKSHIYGEIISLAVEKGGKVLFLVHRRNLVIQFKDSLEKHFGITAGVIMAGVEFEQGHEVYLTTVQTYSRRMNLEDLEFNRFFIDAGILLIDEAHTSTSAQYKKIIDAYQNKIIIGCTATPCRLDGTGLDIVYDKLLDVASTGWLTDNGFLTPVRYFVGEMPDLAGVKVSMGDYQKKDLAEKIDKPKIVGDVVANWLRLGDNRKTIVFAVNVAHALSLRDEFVRCGIPAEHLDARSPDDERKVVLDDLSSGKIRVVTNVALFVEGMDIPSISCVVMARPTKSLALWRQTAGRGMRINSDHDDLILLDHGGNVERLGFLTDDVQWTLDGKARMKKKKPVEKEKKPMKCRGCGLIFEGESKCPDCGTEAKSFGRKIETADGELKEVDPKKENRITPWSEKRLIMGGLKWYCDQHGKHPGYSAHLYRWKYGCWPNDKRVKNVPQIKPEGAIANMIKHIVISKAKSYSKNYQGKRTI